MKKLFGLALASAVAGLCVAAVKKDKTKQQAPALELPIVPSKPDHSKKAILVVSFGTSYEETREKTIGAIEEDFRRAFPDFEVRRAFTSGMIIRKLKERDGIEIDSVKQALQKLFDEGFGTVICQPTHVMNGFEFDDVRKEVDVLQILSVAGRCSPRLRIIQRLPVHCGKNFPIFSRILLWS